MLLAHERAVKAQVRFFCCTRTSASGVFTQVRRETGKE
jgi:hypothetical protein